MPVLHPLIGNFCFEQLGFGEFWSHFQSANLTRDRTAPAGKFLWKETFLQGNWERLVPKECVKNTLWPQQEGLVQLHMQGKRGSDINSAKVHLEWGKAKPGGGNGFRIIQQVSSAALNGK